jgi:hypothetical protein
VRIPWKKHLAPFPCFVQSARLGVVTAMTAVIVSSCASGRSEQRLEADSGVAVATAVSLTLENHNWADVVIFVEIAGHRQRLGLAKAASTTALRVPAHWINSARPIMLVAHRVGSPNEFRSEAFIVLPEQSVTWTLETDLSSSSLMLR